MKALHKLENEFILYFHTLLNGSEEDPNCFCNISQNQVAYNMKKHEGH